MPKATVAGASVADADGVCRTFEPLAVQVGQADEAPAEQDGGESPSAGSNSSESGAPDEKNSNTSGEPPLSPAPTTENPSPQDPTANSAADTTNGSTTASATTSRSKK